jgi:hypothetical protein
MIIVFDSFFFFIYSFISILLIWLINFLAVARFTYSIVSRLIRLISIIVFNVENDLLFVIELTKLLLSWIHFISMISRLSYDCLRIITFIINRFSIVIFSRTRQLYKNLLSMTSIKKWKCRAFSSKLLSVLNQHQNHESLQKVRSSKRYVWFVCILLRINAKYSSYWLNQLNKWRNRSARTDRDYSQRMNR